jgi:hypothetical protein
MSVEDNDKINTYRARRVFLWCYTIFVPCIVFAAGGGILGAVLLCLFGFCWIAFQKSEHVALLKRLAAEKHQYEIALRLHQIEIDGENERWRKVQEEQRLQDLVPPIPNLPEKQLTGFEDLERQMNELLARL